MILVDANLLIYASVNSVPQHKAAKAWLDEKLNGDAPVGLPWQSLAAFLRIVTNPRIFSPPVSADNAWAVLSYWLDCRPVWIPQPTERHAEILGRIYADLHPTANLVPDAILAALATEHGLVLCSTDTDFARFPDLRWQNPINRQSPKKPV